MYSELGDMSTQFRNSVIDAGRTVKNSYKLSRLIKIGVQVLHISIGLGFFILAFYEFILNPPYFDLVGYSRRYNNSVFNATRDDSGEIRRVMDLPIFLLFIVYFFVLIWKKGWGAWSLLMTLSMTLVLFVFLLVNYIARDQFQWSFFSSRGYGILIHVFSFALGWDCVVSTVFTKIEWFPFTFLSSDRPRTLRKKVWLQEKVLLVLWNFVNILVFLFFCLLIWFSRLYYSWACVRSLDDVLLMCQFTDLVQCYSCEEAEFCTDLRVCIKTAKLMFHCQTPIGLLHKVDHALCIFNYNIGFFTFLMVFAYVGGTYFFFLGVTTFLAKLIGQVTILVVKFMGHKTKPHIKKAYSSVARKRRKSKTDDGNSSDNELLGDEENHGLLRTVSDDNLPINFSSGSQLPLITDIINEDNYS